MFQTGSFDGKNLKICQKWEDYMAWREDGGEMK